MQSFIKKLNKDKIILGIIIGLILFVLSFPLEKISGTDKTDKTLDNESETKTEVEINDKTKSYKEYLENELESILQKVNGAGNVKVMITFSDNGEKVVEKDLEKNTNIKKSSNEEKSDEEDNSEKTVTVMGNSQNPWVSQEIMPKISGVAVVAQGGGNINVKTDITETIEALFGIPIHKIKVLEGNVK